MASRHRLRATAVAGTALAFVLGCDAAPPASAERDGRPSILLVVIDTLRADAVSAYGSVEGTTPTIDALAQEGLLYTHAYAPSPWTVPSHATLLTGLRVDQHRVGVGGRMTLAEESTTLAERLRDAGYQTAGFAENVLVSATFGMNQGFEHFAASSPALNLQPEHDRWSLVKNVLKVLRGGALDVIEGRDRSLEGIGRTLRWTWDGITAAVWAEPFDSVGEARDVFADLDPARPRFVFVNLMDAHEPYTVRAENPFVPADASEQELRRFAAPGITPFRICDRLPSPREIALLRGLYHGEARAADAKVAALREALLGSDPARPLITVVTADHGEHFGEHRLLDHQFSVRNPVLHVPLVVHGLDGVPPGRVETPVELGDLAPSVLAWAGLDVPAELPGRRLPTHTRGGTEERGLLAIYSDAALKSPDDFPRAWRFDQPNDEKRAGCSPRDRVFGSTAALTRYPFKLIWFERHPPELYDVSWDAREAFDLAAKRPEVAAGLAGELAARLDGAGLSEGDRPEVPAEALEALRRLGYVE